MKLRVASEASFECGIKHGCALPGAVKVEEALDTLTVAKIDEGKPSLLVKEAAESACTQARIPGKLGQRTGVVAIADKPGSALYCRVNVHRGYVARMLEALPGEKQCISDACVEKRRMLGGGEIGKKIAEPLQILLSEASAGFAFERGLREGPSRRIESDPTNHPTAEDCDPHAEVGGLLDEDVILRGKQPEEVAAADLITAAPDEVDASTASYEVQFEFGVSMAAIGRGKVVVLPDSSVQFSWQMKMLTHDKKR